MASVVPELPDRKEDVDTPSARPSVDPALDPELNFRPTGPRVCGVGSNPGGEFDTPVKSVSLLTSGTELNDAVDAPFPFDPRPLDARRVVSRALASEFRFPTVDRDDRLPCARARRRALVSRSRSSSRSSTRRPRRRRRGNVRGFESTLDDTAAPIATVVVDARRRTPPSTRPDVVARDRARRPYPVRRVVQGGHDDHTRR